MNKFYPHAQLVNFKMEDFKNEILGKRFICEAKDRKFNCLVKNIIPAQPDNLPAVIVVKIEGGKTEEVSVLAIERLTEID